MATSRDSRSLLVLAFDSALRARESLTTAEGLEQRGMLRVHSAVFVRKDADGGPFTSQTRHPGSSVFGGVIAVLFTRELGSLILPGDTALALLISDATPDALAELCSNHGVRFVQSVPPAGLEVVDAARAA